MKPARETDSKFGRDVRSILDAERVGVIPGDNAGEVVKYRHNSANLPIRVPVKVRSEPLAVLVIRVDRAGGGDGFVSSCNRLGWYWRGTSVEVSSLSDLIADTDYDVTLWILKGPING